LVALVKRTDIIEDRLLEEKNVKYSRGLIIPKDTTYPIATQKKTERN